MCSVSAVAVTFSTLFPGARGSGVTTPLWVPMMRQKLVFPPEKVPFWISSTFPCVTSLTLISSIKNSPEFSRPKLNSFHVVGLPDGTNAPVPLILTFCQVDRLLSSLASHASPFELSECGSINSRLEPPPSAHWLQRPPSAYVTWSAMLSFTSRRVTVSPLPPSLPLNGPKAGTPGCSEVNMAVFQAITAYPPAGISGVAAGNW